MDDVQERELRQWGEALAESPDSERRAMGKAIVMLLDQIESLKTSLAEAQPQPFGPSRCPGFPVAGRALRRGGSQ